MTDRPRAWFRGNNGANRNGGGNGQTPPPGGTGNGPLNPVARFVGKGLDEAAEHAPLATGLIGGGIFWDGLDHLRDAFIRNEQDDRPNLELKNILLGLGELTLGGLMIGSVIATPNGRHKAEGVAAAGGAMLAGYLLSNWRGALISIGGGRGN